MIGTRANCAIICYVESVGCSTHRPWPSLSSAGRRPAVAAGCPSCPRTEPEQVNGMPEKSKGAGDLPDAGLRENLLADCRRCFGLCCVALPFSASADFAIDKPAGHACPNLRTDFGCDIHQILRTRGFPGCTVYEC